MAELRLLGLDVLTSSNDFFFSFRCSAESPGGSTLSLGTLRAWVKKSFAARVEIFSMKYVLPRVRSTKGWRSNTEHVPRGAMNIPPVATTLLTSWTLKLTAPSIT